MSEEIYAPSRGQTGEGPGSSTKCMASPDRYRGPRFCDIKRRRRANRMASARLGSESLEMAANDEENEGRQR